jgi:hypothetical protein
MECHKLGITHLMFVQMTKIGIILMIKEFLNLNYKIYKNNVLEELKKIHLEMINRKRKTHIFSFIKKLSLASN